MLKWKFRKNTYFSFRHQLKHTNKERTNYYTISVCIFQTENNERKEREESTHGFLEDIAEDIFHNVKYHKAVGEEEETRQHNLCYEEARQLLSFEDAPEYLKHNIFITSGYRRILNTELCLERYINRS